MRRLWVIALLALAACSSPPVAASGPGIFEIDGEAPVLAGETLTGGSLSPSQYRGRPLVVNFWATWCEPCKREQPVLSSAHAEAGDDGAFFVGINYLDDNDAARDYLEEFDVAYPSLGDPDGDIGRDFGITGLPTTVVIDAEGRLRYRVGGELDEETLDRLLAEIAVG